MIKVSIIIPVFNAQDYLERCLNSVINQTLKDIEIICIDDCSTDNSLQILNNYEKNYPQVIVVHLDENAGESVARNVGLDIAQGEYQGFVDNDDEIDLDFYEKLYNKAIEDSSDISKGVMHEIGYDGKDNYSKLNELIKTKKSKFLFAHEWWTGIFKTSIIKENKIRFIKGYPLGGDVLFLNEVVIHSKSISLVDDVFYHYYRRENSGLSKVLTFEKIESVLNIHVMMAKNIKALGVTEQGSKYVNTWCLEVCFQYIFKSKALEALKFCIDKAFTIYQIVSPNCLDLTRLNNSYPCQMDFIKNNNKQGLIELYLKNNTPMKILTATLRYRTSIGQVNDK